MAAWTKSGIRGAAERVHSIHDGMIAQYEQTGDERIAPTVKSYNLVLKAWAKQQAMLNTSKFSNNAPNADTTCGDSKDHYNEGPVLLQRMINDYQQGKSMVEPDATSFAYVIKIYSDTDDCEKIQMMQSVWDQMEELQIEKSVFVYACLQNAYARSGRLDAIDKTKEILDQMANEASERCKPSTINYNSVLLAYSKSYAAEATIAAERLLNDLIDGTFGVPPDRLSYAMTMSGAYRCSDAVLGTKVAGRVLSKIENVVQQPDGTGFFLDVEFYNMYLSVARRSKQGHALSDMFRTIDRMVYLASQGHNVSPNRRSYNAVLTTMVDMAVNSTALDYADIAERYLADMWEFGSKNRDESFLPDCYFYTNLLGLYQRTSHQDAAPRADRLVRAMEQLYEDGKVNFTLDVVHYTILCSTWAKHPSYFTGIDSILRITQIIQHMKERTANGFSRSMPNSRTYNALMDAFVKANAGERAEELLYYLIDQYRSGETTSGPDGYSFNSVLLAYTRRQRFNLRSAAKAESTLELLLQYSEDEDPSVRPSSRCFEYILSYYSRSQHKEAPYRAEYLLNLLLDRYEDTGSSELEPSSMCFTSVMKLYADQRLPDGGIRAERLRRTVQDLESSTKRLRLDTEFLNHVIDAWQESGNSQAGYRAEIHLDTMEREYARGNRHLEPNSLSYQLTIAAWARSDVPGKAESALAIFRRMMEKHNQERTARKRAAKSNSSSRKTDTADNNNNYKRNNRRPPLQRGPTWTTIPDSTAASLVINACVFAQRDDGEQASSWKIGTAMMDEMHHSRWFPPSLRAYLWFFQLCGNAYDSGVVPTREIDNAIRKAFEECRDRRMLKNPVLRKMDEVLPHDLLQELLQPGLEKEQERRQQQGQEGGEGYRSNYWGRPVSGNYGDDRDRLVSERDSYYTIDSKELPQTWSNARLERATTGGRVRWFR